jgi:hypothetical protein
MLHYVERHLAAQVNYWHSQVHRQPPLDHSSRGERGVIEYAHAVDCWHAAVDRLARFRARMSEVAEPSRQIDMDDCIA